MKKTVIDVHLPPDAKEVAPGIWGWDRPPQEFSVGPETDTPEDAEIRALVKKRQAERTNQLLTRNTEEAMKNCGIESIDRICTKPRKKKKTKRSRKR